MNKDIIKRQPMIIGEKFPNTYQNSIGIQRSFLGGFSSFLNSNAMGSQGPGVSGTPSNPSGEPLQRSIRKAQTNEILFERKVLILRSVDSEIALRGHARELSLVFPVWWCFSFFFQSGFSRNIFSNRQVNR